MRTNVKDELDLAFMDLDKEVYRIKKITAPNIEYITGLLEYIDKLQSELYAIPCNTGNGCICLNRDYTNGTSCKIHGLNFKVSDGCKYYQSVESYKEEKEYRRFLR